MSGMGGGGVRAGGRRKQTRSSDQAQGAKSLLEGYGDADSPHHKSTKPPEKKRKKQRRGGAGQARAQRGQTAILTRVACVPAARQVEVARQTTNPRLASTTSVPTHPSWPPTLRHVDASTTRRHQLVAWFDRYVYVYCYCPPAYAAPRRAGRTRTSIAEAREDNGGVMDRWASARAIF